MKRILMGVACLVALAIVVPAGTGVDVAQAAKKAKALSCKAKSLAGKAVSWKCKVGEKCCFDAFSGTGTCAPKAGICL
ncbi:MAG: hypothetical protein F9K44_11845 [Hyphomicrobiaceae bacterium]|nr:MAG: hypothetical protein F9K44_11845 [Hyphomicrobiaceae bacterium]